MFTSTDSRHLRVSVAILSQAHQIIDAEAFCYAHHSNAAYYGLFSFKKKKIDNFTISHASLKKMFSPYLNLALLELSFYLGGGAGLGRRTVTREWSQKHVLSPLVKGDHL